MKWWMFLLMMLVTGTLAAQERQMLSTIDAYTRMQGVMLNERQPVARANLTTEDLLVQAPAMQPQRQMLSTMEAYQNSLAWQMGGESAYPLIPQGAPQASMPQWYGYQPVQSAVWYAPPLYYAAPYPQQYSQSVAAWLFGASQARPQPGEAVEPPPEPVVSERSRTVPVAAVIAPLPSPRSRDVPRATPTPIPAPPTPAPPDAAHVEAAQQAAAEQHLARLAQATQQARQDAVRWMSATILFGLVAGGFCLYTLWPTRPKEG